VRGAGVIAIVAVALMAAGGAGAKATAFELVFDGRHTGLMHEGTFTTSSEQCASGTASDVSVDAETATRQFNCVGGDGFKAKVSPLPSEHGGNGSWQIIGGTGALADLRGKGAFVSIRLSGNPNDPTSITFRSTWDGVADLDVTPPTIAFARATARKLTRSKSTWDIHVGFVLRDNDEDVVSYVLQIVHPRQPSIPLVYKLGQPTTGAVQLRLRLRVAKPTRVLQARLRATDAVGNATALTRTIRLG
jgi:hypothetical protein